MKYSPFSYKPQLFLTRSEKGGFVVPYRVRRIRLGRRWAAMVFALLAAFVLAGIAGAWRLPWLSQTDLEFSLWLQRGQGPRANVVMRLLTDMGTEVVMVPAALLAAFFLRRQGKNRESVAAVLCLLAIPLNYGLKLLTNRPRPGNPVSVITETFGTSFPSGHSMGSAAVYGTLAAIVWSVTGRAWATAALVAIPVGVGVSRVFLGAHWGYDVMGGWAAGALCVAGVVAWMRRGVASESDGDSALR